MTQTFRLPEASKPVDAGLIKIAVLAVGGQGGGVLSSWIVSLAEANGYRAQVTSVPGVAQRTGATVYYVEMLPDTGREPVLALMPAPGDLDIVIAAEMMEAGRAVTRGFVTEDRTTLIASDHRVFAVSEKVVPGDGQADAHAVRPALKDASKRLVCFDMDKLAVDTGSHISACLFGALAGSGALPFGRVAFEETIRASGRGVEASLRAFGQSYETAKSGQTPSAETVEPDAPGVTGAPALAKQWAALEGRVARLPEAVQPMATAGLRSVVDYQDTAYGAEYLDLLEAGVADDKAADKAYSQALAKYLARAMCYDDTIRVADLKTRARRFGRVRDHARPGEGAVMTITEYMHPRGEEIVGMMPASLGRFVTARPRLSGWIDRRISKGRRLRTDRLSSFLVLYGLAGLRPMRRRLLRHDVEVRHRDAWLSEARRCLSADYDLAVEVLSCRRLIKGYSDTHARGQSKFDRVLGAVPMLEGRADAADWLRRLREAALADVDGTKLDGAIKTVRSFAQPANA